MHYNNYVVKCVYGTIVIDMKDKTKAMIGTTDPVLNEERRADGFADSIRPAAGSRWPNPCVVKPIPALRTAYITVHGYWIVLRCRKVRKRVVTRPGPDLNIYSALRHLDLLIPFSGKVAA
jgi:hypothetical protein